MSPARRAAARTSNDPSTVATRSPGCAATTRAIATGSRRVRASGSAPTVTVPCVTPESAAISAEAMRSSASARFTRSARIAPAGFGSMPFGERSNRGVPMLSSKLRTAMLTADWVTPRLSATDGMWCCSVSATNARRRRSGTNSANTGALRIHTLGPTQATTSRRARSISACATRALASSTRPNSVNSMPLARRSKSGTPNARSSS